MSSPARPPQKDDKAADEQLQSGKNTLSEQPKSSETAKAVEESPADAQAEEEDDLEAVGTQNHVGRWKLTAVQDDNDTDSALETDNS